MTAQAHSSEIATLHRLARRMDALVRIPGTSIDVGLDSLLGLVPVVGDALAAAPAIYIIARARRLGASRGTLAAMALNTALDWALGSIPVLGDLFDAGFNANIRNVTLLERNLARQAAGPANPRAPAPATP